MSNRRLEDILIALTQQYAPDLLQTLPRDPRLRQTVLADSLARQHGFLVLRGDFPSQFKDNPNPVVAGWLQPYQTLYRLLVRHLRANRSENVYWSYGDRFLPPIVIFDGQVTGVTQVLASYVVPYVVERQRVRLTNYDAELRGVCMYMIDALGGHNYRYSRELNHAAMQQVRAIIDQPIRQRGLTSAAANLFPQTPPEPMPAASKRPLNLPQTNPITPLDSRDVQAIDSMTDSQFVLRPGDDELPLPPTPNHNGHHNDTAQSNGHHHNGVAQPPSQATNHPQANDPAQQHEPPNRPRPNKGGFLPRQRRKSDRRIRLNAPVLPPPQMLDYEDDDDSY